ncbi:hypothetical protein D3C76_1212700 [compost metagenome]
MQKLACGFQVFAAGQFEGDGREAGQCRNAHQRQHQPGIFVLDFGDAFHVGRFRSHGEPQHQQQIDPDAGIPADEDLADRRIGRSQKARRDAQQDGGGQARVGACEENHGGSMGWGIANTLAQVPPILKSQRSLVGASLLAMAN